MKQPIALAAILLAASAAASASPDHERFDRDFRMSDHFKFSTVRAPEIDPASMIAGLTLLSGGLAVIRGRRQSKPKA